MVQNQRVLLLFDLEPDYLVEKAFETICVGHFTKNPLSSEIHTEYIYLRVREPEVRTNLFCIYGK